MTVNTSVNRIVYNSAPPLGDAPTHRVTVITDGSLTTDGDGLRIITGAAVTPTGGWIAWYDHLPRAGHDSGSLLAELVSPLLALAALGRDHRVTVVTDNMGVVAHLSDLVGEAALVPYNLTGGSFRLPQAPKPRELHIVHTARTHPQIHVAHTVAALMHTADRTPHGQLAATIDKSVRRGLGLVPREG